MQEQLFVTQNNKDASDTGSVSADTAPRRMEWELDEQTKEIGRRGLANARAALQHALDETEFPAAA